MLTGYGDECVDYDRVNGTTIIKEASCDLLDEFLVLFIEEWGVVWR